MSLYSPDNPCFIDGAVCDPAYTYQHHLNFTSDGNLFTVSNKLTINITFIRTVCF